MEQMLLYKHPPCLFNGKKTVTYPFPKFLGTLLHRDTYLAKSSKDTEKTENLFLKLWSMCTSLNCSGNNNSA
ncbi:hypothetical protein XELAEV_18039834mg [Xenopus laevis]|uniref:Uncharacterized protein n=1 Tax=Xenopus laevis TaxID=8355 RepID=A0A974C8I4_XENLA|nr:hypothetical protein XELAEV_18039834mg [Xenopus laevis]